MEFIKELILFLINHIMSVRTHRLRLHQRGKTLRVQDKAWKLVKKLLHNRQLNIREMVVRHQWHKQAKAEKQWPSLFLFLLSQCPLKKSSSFWWWSTSWKNPPTNVQSLTLKKLSPTCKMFSFSKNEKSKPKIFRTLLKHLSTNTSNQTKLFFNGVILATNSTFL